MRFKNYLTEDDDLIQLIELSMFIEDDKNLNESIDIHAILKKMGLKAKKGKGLLAILKDTSKGVAKVIKLSFKLYLNKDDEKIKQELVNAVKSVKKEQIYDVLLKLDTLTLHAITEPIHILDAITGWHIAPNIEKEDNNISTRIEKALSHLIKVHDTLEPGQNMRIKISHVIQKIKKIFRK